MNIDDIINDSAFHDWQNYAPNIVQYLKYTKDSQYLLAVGHKIEDVYRAFCNARASLIHANSSDFGDIAGDENIDKLYAKYHFLLNSIMEYALCLDISWQVVWAYTQTESLDYLIQQNFCQIEKDCNRDSVLERLNYIISQHAPGFSKIQAILSIVTDFDNNPNTIKLRSINNKIKHRGTIHFEGLGTNYTNLPIVVNGKKIPILHRDHYAVNDIENMLFEYHNNFQVYINGLIDIMMPSDYLNEKIDLKEGLNSLLHLSN